MGASVDLFLSFPLLQSLPVSGNTAILNGFPLLHLAPPPPGPTSSFSHLLLESPTHLSGSPTPHPPLHCALLSPPTNQYSPLPLSTPHVTHIWLTNKLWMRGGPLTSHLKFLLCLSMADRYLTSPHVQSRPCPLSSPGFFPLFFLFVYDSGLVEVHLVLGSLGLQLSKKK